MDIRKMQFAGLALVLLAGAVFAGTETISYGICNLYTFIQTLVPVITMLMLVGAGATYAGGQMMGAETRARANVWATSMLTGALIGIVIIVVAPSILGTMGDYDLTTCSTGGA